MARPDASAARQALQLIAQCEDAAREYAERYGKLRERFNRALASGNGEAVRALDPAAIEALGVRAAAELSDSHHAVGDALELLARVCRAHAHVQTAALAKARDWVNDDGCTLSLHARRLAR